MKKEYKAKKNLYYDGLPHTMEIELTGGNRDTILQWLYDIDLVPWYVTYVLRMKPNEPLAEEAIQEMWVLISEISQEKWDDLYNQGYICIASYITGLIHRQLKSYTSTFYKKFTKHDEIITTKSDDFWDIVYDTYGEEEDGEKFTKPISGGNTTDAWFLIESGRDEELSQEGC